MATETLLRAIWSGLGGEARALAALRLTGEGDWPSVFAVTPLAAASIAAAGLAAAELIAERGGAMPEVQVDRRLASLWFRGTLRPEGWSLPPPWDPIAGDYRARDGWIRLHTNAPHHRAAALRVLGVAAEKAAVAEAVAPWSADRLEQEVVGQGGCAAAMRSLAEWAAHPQGAAVALEPLLAIAETDAAPRAVWPLRRDRPLAGLRVLDLTRVLAGPVATRFLAILGAEVLRLDPPGWDEPSVIPEMSLGKRCARLDLRAAEDRERFTALLRGADILIHGYRPEALARLGFDAAIRRELSPGLIDVTLDAYGWTGRWRGRRGFDSLVQMSAGIAATGMARAGGDKPVPLPVQALDHATGYLMAAAALRSLTHRLRTGRGWEIRASLARTAALLAGVPAGDRLTPLAPATAADLSEIPESTAWGPARRLRAPLMIAGAPLGTERGASALGSAPAEWSGGAV